MDKKEYKRHCLKQIDRCIKIGDSQHLREHELSLALLSENEELKQEVYKYKREYRFALKIIFGEVKLTKRILKLYKPQLEQLNQWFDIILEKRKEELNL